MNVHGLLRGSGTALLLKDPKMIRRWLKIMDIYLGPKQTSFFNDGMYCDQSISYQGQVAWRLGWACANFNEYRDPPGYIDKKTGLKLDGTYSFDKRWPLLPKANPGISNLFKWPDGSVIALGDTHANPHKQAVAKNIHKRPDLNLHHFNCFSIQSGNGKDQMMAVMNAKPTATGLPYSWGHNHGDHLGLNLWACGTEALPDQGYASYSKGYSSAASYFFRNPRQHNTIFAWNYNTENYGLLKGGNWSTPDYYGYDDGSESDKKVSLLHLGCRGKIGEKITKRDRLLVMIGINKQRSYLIDIGTLSGGNRHESYLIQPEEEDCKLQSTYKLTKSGKNLYNILAPTNLSKLGDYNFANYRSHLTYYKNVQEAVANKSGSFTWIGSESGSHFKFFMNHVTKSRILFSKAPQLRRRIVTKGSAWDKFRGWHLCRSRDVSPFDTTIFGIVFDSWGASDNPIIKRVNWIQMDDDKDKAILLSVTYDSGTDFIYSSTDNKTREVRVNKKTLSFTGFLGIVHLGTEKTPLNWVYSRSGTIIEINKKSISDIRPIWSAKLISTERCLLGEGRSALIIKGSPPQEIVGKWIRCVFGKGGSMGLKVIGIETIDKENSRLLIGMEHGISPNISDKPIAMTQFTPPILGNRVEYHPVVFKQFK